MKRIKISRKHWPVGISDGLILQCSVCKDVPEFDYKVKDDFWKRVIPKEYQQDVICLACLDVMAVLKGLDVSEYLEEVQFTGKGKTIILTPIKVYLYSEPEKSVPNTHIGSHTHINHRYDGKR